MADMATERAVEVVGGRLEHVSTTPAVKGIDEDKPAPWRCNIVLVPGGSSTSTGPTTSETSKWPWLDHSPNGPAAQLSSFLSLRKIPTTTFRFNYNVPLTRQGITLDTVRKNADDLIMEIGRKRPSQDISDSLEGVDDYGTENDEFEKDESVDGPQASESVSVSSGKTNLEDAKTIEDEVVEDVETCSEAPGDGALTTGDKSTEVNDGATASGSGPVPGVTISEPQVPSPTELSHEGEKSAEKTESDTENAPAQKAVDDGMSPEDKENQGNNASSISDDTPGEYTPVIDDDIKGNANTEAEEDDKSSREDDANGDDGSDGDATDVDADVPSYFIFVAQDLGGLIVKEALSLARTTIGEKQYIAACTTLLLFYETPCPSAGHESTWDSLANWLLCTSQQGMLFSSAWIHNTAHMIESVCSDFALSEPIYRVLNVRCAAHELAPFLRQDPLDRPPSTAALMSLGEEILGLKRTPYHFISTLNSLALTQNGVPRSYSATVISDSPRRARMVALRKVPGVSSWISNTMSSGFSGFIVRSEDEASVLFEVLQKDCSSISLSAHLRHLTQLEELNPIDQGERNPQQDTTTPSGTSGNSAWESMPKAVITYVFDPYNNDSNTATALLASLCYQLMCMRRQAFAHTSELVYYFTERSKERVWPLDKLLVLFRSLLSCPDEGNVACILWEMPGTVLPQGLVSTLAALASGSGSALKLAVISSRADVEFPSVPSTAVAPAKRATTIPSLGPYDRLLARAPSWATDEPHVFRLLDRSVDLPVIVDREIALLLGRRLDMRSVQDRLKYIILDYQDTQDSDNNDDYNSGGGKPLFSGSHAEVAASVRAWLELITHRAAPISIASIVREAPKMPTSMAGLYAATLSYTPPALLLTIQQLLAWLSLAKRPMTNAELAVALAVLHTPEGGCVHGVESLVSAKTMDELDAHKPVNVQDDLLALLGSAVHTDNAGRPLLQAELIDLLQRDRASPPASPIDPDENVIARYSLPDAHNTLARICLAFLRICQDKYSHITKSIINGLPFLEYAVLHWPYHYASGSLSCHNTAHSDTASARSWFTYLGDESLMEFWAGIYHELRKPGLNPPVDNVALCMAADVGCLDLINRVLKYTSGDKVADPAFSDAAGSGTAVSPLGLSQALLYAIAQGDLYAVKRLQSAGAKSRYAVHVAVASNQNSLLHHFGSLSKVANVKDRRGYTPIQIAAATGNISALEDLLPSYTSPGFVVARGFDYDTDIDNYESTEWNYDSRYYEPTCLPVLHIACMFGHVAVVKRLLQENSINPNEFDMFYNRAIFYAGLLQQPDAMRALLDDSRTDPSLIAEAYFRRPPLQVAALLQRADMVELLLDNLQSRLTPEAVAKDNASVASGASGASEPPLTNKSSLEFALHFTDRFSLTALHIAAYYGQVNVGKALLANGMKGPSLLQTVGQQMAIPLHFAATYDHTDFMKMLLDSGDAKDQLEAVLRDGNGRTALHMVARNGNFAASMRVLVDAHVKENISLDAFDSGPRSALHYAALRGSAANTRLLLDAGATKDVVDGDSATPLRIACRNGFVDVVQVLLDRGADASLFDSSRITPLMAAAWCGSVPIMKALLEKTTSKELLEIDSDGKTALHYAVMSKSYEAVILVLQSIPLTTRTLKEVHSTVERPGTLGDQIIRDRGDLLLDNSGGSMPIEASAESDLMLSLLPAVKNLVKDLDALCQILLLHAASVGHLHNIEALVKDYDVDLNAVDGDGRTALSFASERGRVRLVRFLARKTKPGQDKSGQSPLAYAISNGHTRVVDVLLSHGHEEEVKMTDADNRSPLYLAAYQNNEHIVKVLLKHNADPNTPNLANEDTPLHCAVMYASAEVVRLIAKAPGVNGYARNKDGRTPMAVAAYYGGIDEARALLSARWKSNDRTSSRHSSPLHDAYKDESLIRLFVEEGKEDVNALDSKGRTALHLASRSPRGQVSLLLDLGANPMIVDDANQETSLHAAAFFRDQETFEKMLKNEHVPPLSQLKYIVSKTGETIFDMAVSSDNTAVVAYLLDAEDSPFRVVEQSSNGAKSLALAIRNNFQDTTKLMLARIKDSASQLTDDIKRKHLGALLEALFQNALYSLADMERVAKELILAFTGARDDSGMAGREAWVYLLVFQSIIGSDQCRIHARQSFPQLATGIWAELRDHNGWTYPQLLNTMEEIDNTSKSGADSDLDSMVSVPEDLPSPEERLLYGLEEVVVADEDRAALDDNPASPRLPTSWSATLSHKDIIWTPRPSTTAATDEKAGESSNEAVLKAGRATDKSGSAPKLFASCPTAPYMHYLSVADYPVPPNRRFYFSILVVDQGGKSIVGAGVGYGSTPKSQMPGWDAGTWGYHGDNGGYYHDLPYSLKLNEKGLYGTGDTVSVYVDTAQHKLFFAINGNVLDTGFARVYGRVFPVVGLGDGASIKATFGSPDGKDPFKDADGNDLMDKVAEWL